MHCLGKQSSHHLEFSYPVERAAYAALSASDGDYEELEDDFLFIANEGKVALELVSDSEDDKKGGKAGILKKPYDAAE